MLALVPRDPRYRFAVERGGVERERVSSANVQMTFSEGTRSAMSSHAQHTATPLNESSVTLFLPAWNEAAALPAVVGAAHRYLSEVTGSFSIVVVDDGSSDDTPRVMAELATHLPGVRTVRHPINLGYGAALRTGFQAGLADGSDWVGYCDADGQFDPADLGLLIDGAQRAGAEIAIGYRIERADDLARRAMGRGWHLVTRLALGVDARDVDCGFKVFRRAALAALEPRLFGDFATISPELLARAKQADMRIVEVGLEHAPRSSGESSGSSLRVVVGSFRALGRLRRALLDEASIPAAGGGDDDAQEPTKPRQQEYA